MGARWAQHQAALERQQELAFGDFLEALYASGLSEQERELVLRRVMAYGHVCRELAVFRSQWDPDEAVRQKAIERFPVSDPRALPTKEEAA